MPTPPLTYLPAGGYSFATMEAGTGPPVLLIHGSLGSLFEFYPQIEHFRSAFRTIAFSRRFHPPNAVDDDDRSYSMGRQVKDMEGVIDALGIRPTHIVGSSWGAYASLVLVHQRPDIARTLVLGEPPMFPLLRRSEKGQTVLERFQRETMEPSLAGFLRGDKEEGVRRFFDGIAGRNGAFDALSAPSRARLLQCAEELRREFETPFDDYMPPLDVHRLSMLNVPVLLLEGEWSPSFFHIILDELEEALPNTERMIIRGTGHSLHTGNPMMFNKTVELFIKKHEPRSGGRS